MSRSARRLAGEYLGTALLLFVIVGSGISADRLSDDGGVELLMHAIAVGSGLAAIIAFLAPVSGAHFNPAVTVGFLLTRTIEPVIAAAYVVSQLLGAVTGVVVANVVFGEGALAGSGIVRSGQRLFVSEFIVTFVLVLIILGLVRSGRMAAAAGAVGAWVATIILASPSTGFANPAVTVARGLTDTYTGIANSSIPWFIAAQLVGGIAAAGVAFILYPSKTEAVEGAEGSLHGER